MTRLTQFFTPTSVSGALVVLSLACALGLIIGAISIRGVKLGVAGVLFAGMFFGAMGSTIEGSILTFIRDFGMTIFVYALGLQVGPGFLASLRQGGLKLNLLAAGTLVGGAIFTIAVVSIFRVERASAPGLYVGGFGTTPGLVAAQQRFLGGEGVFANVDTSSRRHRADLSGIIYALGYPFGCVAPIFVILLVRKLFRIDVSGELAALNADAGGKLVARTFDLTNSQFHGVSLADIKPLREHGLVVGKMLRGEQLTAVTADTKLQLGDVLLVVGPEEKLNYAMTLFGPESKHDLRSVAGPVLKAERLLVTEHGVLRKRLKELAFPRRFGVTITRVLRSGIELTPTANLALNFGDTVVVVGPPESLVQVAAEVGNSTRTLNHPQLVPVFIGIALGVALGMVPIKIPGLSIGIKLGVAVGPLIVAIVLSRIGHIGKLVWYMPNSANFMFREFGLAIFLACVGFSAGKPFVKSFANLEGLGWMGLAALVSIIPMLVVAVFARLYMKMNFITLCGLISGAMTNSPSLAYATDITRSDDAAVVYATVYPLSIVLPVVVAQLLAVWSV